jgi:hypothetical protein
LQRFDLISAEGESHMNKPNHHVLKAEDLKVGTTDGAANTAILIIEALRSPLTTTVVVPPNANGEASKEAANDPAARKGGPGFKLALIAVIAITFLSGIALVVMAAAFPDPANALQTRAFEAMIDAFWAGIGALVGLIGGKVT